jgi:hypothetical protein
VQIHSVKSYYIMSILKIILYKCLHSSALLGSTGCYLFVKFFKNPIDPFFQGKRAWPSLADWTDRLSQNVGIQLPTNAV